MGVAALPLSAVAWMMGAILSFSSMAVAGREVSFALDTFEIMLFRSVIGVLIVVPVAFGTGHWRRINTRNLHIHVIRNVAHFTGQNLWFFAIASIPLAQVFALEFSQPLWVALLAPLVLGERLTKRGAVAVLLGFVGILIVARPDPSGLSPGVLAAAAASLGFAGSTLATKRLTRTDSVTKILFWLTTMQAAMGLFCAGIDGEIAVPSAANWPWLFVIGIAGLSAHFCLTKALSIAPATQVVPIDFLRLPLIAVVGMVLYGEPLELAVLAGGAVILAANYLNLQGKRRAAPQDVSAQHRDAPRSLKP